MAARRVYSDRLAATTLTNDGFAVQYYVPDGHRWVIKSLTWSEVVANEQVNVQAYGIFVEVEYQKETGGPQTHTVIQDFKLYGARPGEWEGRLTLRAGDRLLTWNITEPWDGLHPVTFSFHGFDFIDTPQP